MKTLVIGSGGQFGHELCRQFGPEAVGLDLPELNLTDHRGTVKRVLARRPTAVVNAAAYTQVDRAEEEPERCHAVNADGVATLVEACRKLDCPLVHLSSDYVFGLGKGRSTPYREDERPKPRGVYAQSKYDGERLATAWPKHYLVRTCGLYGRPAPRASGNFIQTMLRLASEGHPISVVDDQYVAPSYVVHVARAVRFLLGTGAFGTYHVVNAGATTWYGFACEIFRQMGLEAPLEPISTADYALAAPRPAYSLLDTTKYHALDGAPPLPSWQEALAEYLSESAP